MTMVEEAWLLRVLVLVAGVVLVVVSVLLWSVARVALADGCAGQDDAAEGDGEREGGKGIHKEGYG